MESEPTKQRNESKVLANAPPHEKVPKVSSQIAMDFSFTKLDLFVKHAVFFLSKNTLFCKLLAACYLIHMLFYLESLTELIAFDLFKSKSYGFFCKFMPTVNELRLVLLKSL